MGKYFMGVGVVYNILFPFSNDFKHLIISIYVYLLNKIEE